MNKLCVRIFSKRLDKTIFKYYTIIKKSEKNVKKKIVNVEEILK